MIPIIMNVPMRANSECLLKCQRTLKLGRMFVHSMIHLIMMLKMKFGQRVQDKIQNQSVPRKFCLASNQMLKNWLK